MLGFIASNLMSRDFVPFCIERGIFSDSVVFKVPGVLAGFFLVPPAEGAALLSGVLLGLGDLLALLHALRFDFGAAGGVKADRQQLRDEVVLFRDRAVMERHVLGAGAELIALRVGLAAGVVGLEDGICSRIGSALEVAAGDEGCLLGIGIVILVGVGSGFRDRVNAAADLADLGVGGVVDRVVASRGAVGADLQPLTQLVDCGQIGGVGVAVLDADAVGGNHRVLDAPDMGVQIGVGIGGGTRGACRVRRGGYPLIQRTGIVVDAADLLLGGSVDDNWILAAVNGGDLAQVRQHLVGAAEAVALADQIDDRRVIICGDDSGLVICAIGNGTGSVRRRDGDDVLQVVVIGLHRSAAIVENRGVGRGDGVVGQRSQVAAIIKRIGGRGGDGIVVQNADLGRDAGIRDGQIAAIILCVSKLGGAGIIADIIPRDIRSARRIDKDVLSTSERAVFQGIDLTKIPEREGSILIERNAVDHIYGRNRIVIVILIRRDVQALIGIGLAGQRMAGLAAVAVEEHGVALARPRALGREVTVAQRADIALVLQQVIAVGACAHKADAADAADDAAAAQIANIGLLALSLCGGVRIAAVSPVKFITRQGAGAGVQQRVVICVDEASGDGSDVAAVHDRVVAAGGNRVAVQAPDGGGAAVGRAVMQLDAADLVAIAVIGSGSELAVVVHRGMTRCRDHNPADAVDDAAAGIAQGIVGNGKLGVIRVLVGSDLAAADAADDAAVIVQRAAVIVLGTGILGVDPAVRDGADGGSAGLIFLIVIRSGEGSACHIRPLPQRRVIPPGIVVVHRVALDVSLDVGRRRAVGIHLGGVGVGDKGAVVQLGDDRVVVDRILPDSNSAVLDQVDGAVVADRRTGDRRIGVAPDVAVIDAVGAINGAGVDQRDMTAVVEDGIAPRRKKRHVLELGDRGPVIHDHGGVDVHVLGALQRHVRDAHGTARIVPDNRSVVGNARVADGVRRDPAAADRVLHRQRAAVDDRGHTLICRGRGGGAGVVLPGAALEIQGQIAAVDQAAPGGMAVQIDRHRSAGYNREARGSALLLKAAAIVQHGDGRRSARGDILHGGSQGGIIRVRRAVVRHRTGVEAKDIGLSSGGLAHGHEAAVGIAAGGGDAGEIPDDAVMRIRRNAHLRIRGSGKVRADSHGGVSLLHHIPGLPVDGARLGEAVAGEGLIVCILVFVQHKGGDKRCCSTGQGNLGIGSHIRHVDIRAADSSGSAAGGDRCAKIRQPAGIIGDGVVVLAVVVPGDGLAVVNEVNKEAVPVLAVLVIVPGAGAGAGTVRICLVAVIEVGSIEDYLGFCAVVFHLVDGCGGSGSRGKDDLSVAALRPLGAGDIGAAVGGEERAGNRQGAVDIDFRIRQTSSATDGSGAVGHGIADGVHSGGAGKIEPIVIVIDVDLFPAVDLHGRALVDVDLHAGQQLHVLGNAGGAAVDVHRDIAGNGQNRVVRADASDHRQPGQRHGRHVDVAVDRNMQPIRALDIVLNNIAGVDVEQAAAANEGRAHGIGGAGGIDGGIELLRRPGINRQGHLDVLYIILVEDESVIVHVRGGRAAAPVLDLEGLIDRGAGLRLHLAGAVDIAPAVEVCAGVQGDFAAALHVDASVRAGGGTVPTAHLTEGAQLAAAADRAAALDGDIGSRGHGEGSKGGGHIMAPVYNGRRRGINRARRIKGDQQGDAVGDHIIAGRQSAVRNKSDFGLAAVLSVAHRAVEIGKLLAGHVKDGDAVVHKVRGNRLILGEGQGRRSVGADYVAGIVIHIPAGKAIAASRRCREDKAVRGLLGKGNTGCDRSAVHRIAAVLSGHEGNGDVLLRDQLKIGERDLGAFLLGLAGLDVDAHRLVGIQHEGIRTVLGVLPVDLSNAVVELRLRGKGERRLVPTGVFQRQRSFARGITAAKAAGAGGGAHLARDRGAAARPSAAVI